MDTIDLKRQIVMMMKSLGKTAQLKQSEKTCIQNSRRIKEEKTRPSKKVIYTQYMYNGFKVYSNAVDTNMYAQNNMMTLYGLTNS